MPMIILWPSRRVPLDEIKTVLTNETQTAIKWFKLNMMEANPDKFQVMLLSKKETNSSFHLDVNGSTLIGEPNVKLLGITIDSQMKFVNHTNILCSKAARQLNAVWRLKTLLDTESRLSVVKSFVTSNFSYCPVIWHFSGAAASEKMERILRRSLRIISLDSVSTYESLLTKYDLYPLKTYRERCFALEVFKIKNSLAPKYLEDLIKIRKVPHNTRQKYSLSLRRLTMVYIPLNTTVLKSGTRSQIYVKNKQTLLFLRPLWLSGRVPFVNVQHVNLSSSLTPLFVLGPY